MNTRLDPDELAALEEEREFLLTSLRDLDAELAAGDVEPDDYEALKDDYTRRAASVIRTIETKEAELEAAPSLLSWRKVALVIGVLAVVGVVAGFAVAEFSGTRGASDVASGDIRESVRTRLAEAGSLAAQGDIDGALGLYDEVLAEQPSNAEALAYKGWTLYRAGQADVGLDHLDEAVLSDGEYADARVFRAIVYADQGDFDAAEVELAAFDAADPPPAMQDLVASQGLRGRILAGNLTELVADNESVTLADLGGATADEVAEAGRLLVATDSLTALKLIQAVLLEEPDHPVALTYRAVLVAQSPEFFDEALADLDRAVTVAPDYPDGHYYRALALAQAGRIDEAEAELTLLDDLSPDLASLARDQLGL